MSTKQKSIKQVEIPEVKKTGMDLTVFLGRNEKEQARTLSMIKDACADILIQNTTEDCAFNSKTIEFVSSLYMQSNGLLRQIAA